MIQTIENTNAETNAVSGAVEYRLATFMLQSLVALLLFVGLGLFYIRGNKRKNLKNGDTCLIFLLIPFGTDNNTGNKSWIPIPFIGIHVQPAEICKIFYIMIMASVMASHQNRISHVLSVGHIVVHFFLMAGCNFIISGDLGVTLVFAAIFIGMAIAGGIGNLIDRLANGFVVDFLNFTLIDFPVFNFADICVTVGAAVAVIYLIFFDGKQAKESTNGTEDDQLVMGSDDET